MVVTFSASGRTLTCLRLSWMKGVGTVMYMETGVGLSIAGNDTEQALVTGR